MSGSLSKMPSPNSTPIHWTASRKAALVYRVNSGKLTLEEACERYMMSVQEFASWEQAIEQYGVRGLKATQRPR
jgi:hypothetical protein